ncbi:MAG: MFS transporter [Spirochaetaceae bacterium]|nr:MAG: MFS transporter [Spirochaetaceae bacterium]
MSTSSSSSESNPGTSPPTVATESGVVSALMIPSLMVIMTMAMFAVAVPVIRDRYGLGADAAAWLLVAYSLPFMLCMPLYGRLGDAVGRKRLLVFGIVLFLAGSLMLAFVQDFRFLLAARVVQGMGAAGVNPLSMALILEHVPSKSRGKALGTWNSIGPVAGILGPPAAGLLIDVVSWRFILLPALVLGLLAVRGVSRGLPDVVDRRSARSFLPSFDWVGVVLFQVAVVSFVFFTSSRLVTGVAPFRDFRLAAVAVLSGLAFVVHEARRSDAFIDLRLFRNRNFSLASLCVSIRMMMMGGVSFVVPLLLTDLHGYPASAVGLVLTLHATALLLTMRLGGVMIDRSGRRTQIVLGLLIEVAAMAMFLLLPEGASTAPVLIAVVIHGLGAGLCLAALHIYALAATPQSQAGAAAGLYSMVRFGGSMLGAAIGGVILQAGLDAHGVGMRAYSTTFIFYLVAGVLAAAFSLGLSPRLPGRGLPKDASPAG